LKLCEHAKNKLKYEDNGVFTIVKVEIAGSAIEINNMVFSDFAGSEAIVLNPKENIENKKVVDDGTYIRQSLVSFHGLISEVRDPRINRSKLASFNRSELNKLFKVFFLTPSFLDKKRDFTEIFHCF
jgi:hypothetical protein